jgi:hypothetical protein
MQLTLVAGELQVMEIPLYNDASFREIFAEISGS